MMMTGGGDGQLAHQGLFFRCEDEHNCGLRFPVTPMDRFHDRCPACGSPVRVVAKVGDEATAAHPNLLPVQPESNISLLLDNWRSLFNVGAAFRSADGAGVRHLYLCGITATPQTQRKVAKTALGAEQAVVWSYHPDAVRLAAGLRCEGAELWVLERNARSEPLFDITEWAGTRRVILAAGNEVTGVDPGLLAEADRVIHLPMSGVKESLNVAVALSIATYWLRAREVAAGSQSLQEGKEKG